MTLRPITNSYPNQQIYSNATLCELSQQCGSAQHTEQSMVDYSVPGNRLIQSEEGTVELVSKSPGEIFGEKIEI